MTLVPKNEKLDLMLFSKESTSVNTAIMANIPMVTPNNDRMVLVRLEVRAWIANLKLSHMSLIIITLY